MKKECSKFYWRARLCTIHSNVNILWRTARSSFNFIFILCGSPIGKQLFFRAAYTERNIVHRTTGLACLSTIMDEVMRWKSLLVCTCLIRCVTHLNAKSRTISSAHCTIYIINPVLFRCVFVVFVVVLFCFDFIFLATFCRICIRMQTKKATPNWSAVKFMKYSIHIFFPSQCIQTAPQSQITRSLLIRLFTLYCVSESGLTQVFGISANLSL